jgi:hypothetical protein
MLETYKLLLPATQKVILNNVKDLLFAQTEQTLCGNSPTSSPQNDP